MLCKLGNASKKVFGKAANWVTCAQIIESILHFIQYSAWYLNEEKQIAVSNFEDVCVRSLDWVKENCYYQHKLY